MRAEVPVITGTNSSLPEIAGNAALLCDSRNPEAIAKAMADLASDKILREKMIALGLEQVRKFSWDKSAEGLWSNIEKCLYA
jgi:glycosyltransferase involved in cell wall biosynthesis